METTLILKLVVFCLFVGLVVLFWLLSSDKTKILSENKRLTEENKNFSRIASLFEKVLQYQKKTSKNVSSKKFLLKSMGKELEDMWKNPQSHKEAVDLFITLVVYANTLGCDLFDLVEKKFEDTKSEEKKVENSS